VTVTLAALLAMSMPSITIAIVPQVASSAVPATLAVAAFQCVSAVSQRSCS